MQDSPLDIGAASLFSYGWRRKRMLKKTVEAQTGTWIHMPANLKHSVHTKTPVVMLLLLLKK